jgi:PBP1b-binding outer membrane lipoprotein LpoB
MKRYFLILIVCLFAVGCTKYYKVTNPTSDKVYYTTKIKKKKSGAIRLQDERTGNKVTLHSSEIEKITEHQYNRAILSTESDATQ